MSIAYDPNGLRLISFVLRSPPRNKSYKVWANYSAFAGEVRVPCPSDPPMEISTFFPSRWHSFIPSSILGQRRRDGFASEIL